MIAEIYNPYVAETIITFEEHPVTPEEIQERISKVLAGGLPYLVAEVEGQVCGFAYATPWRVRPAYRFSTERPLCTLRRRAPELELDPPFIENS